ncbi:protein FAM227A-like isoform X3 [Symsagittifera roscoffensis]|uniref:protein FAM227A-like isoform X3 n=1 Tax=Symsagittifera roscoffensis TaxID=84072 RepID=UPI00307C92B3
MARVLTPVDQTVLSNKIRNFNQHLGEFAKYRSKLIEDSDDSGASGSEDEKDTSKTNASSSAKGSSVKSVNAVARKGEHVIPGTILGHVKGLSRAQIAKYEFEKEQREVEEFSSAFAQKAVQKLRLDTALGRGGGHKLNDDSGPKLAELYRYEGFLDHCTNALPGDTNMRLILQTALSAQPQLAFKKTYESEAQHFLLCDLSVDIARDLFWWFFSDKYAHNESTLDKLLRRVSDNYVKFLWQPASSERTVRYRNAFFKNYPDILSQALYCAFCHTFPASWRQFNDKFINNITSKVFLWLTGCKAEYNHHKKWSIADLEPLDLKADFESDSARKSKSATSNVVTFSEDLESIDDARSSSSRSRTRRHNAVFATVGTEHESHSRKDSKHSMHTTSGDETEPFHSRKVQFNLSKKERPYAYKPSRAQKRDLTKSTPMHLKDDCDHHAFNVQGISPLMANYLSRNVTKSTMSSNQVLIGRTELKPQTARPIRKEKEPIDLDDENVTYAQFVSQKFKDNRKVLKDLSEKETKFNKEIADMWKCTNGELRESEEKVQLLVTHDDQVKKLSNLLMLEIMTEPSQRTTLASKAIKEALDKIDLQKHAVSTTTLESQTASTNSLVLNKSLDTVAQRNSPKQAKLPHIAHR